MILELQPFLRGMYGTLGNYNVYVRKVDGRVIMRRNPTNPTPAQIKHREEFVKKYGKPKKGWY